MPTWDLLRDGRAPSHVMALLEVFSRTIESSMAAQVPFQVRARRLSNSSWPVGPVGPLLLPLVEPQPTVMVLYSML